MDYHRMHPVALTPSAYSGAAMYSGISSHGRSLCMGHIAFVLDGFGSRLTPGSVGLTSKWRIGKRWVGEYSSWRCCVADGHMVVRGIRWLMNCIVLEVVVWPVTDMPVLSGDESLRLGSGAG